MARVSKLADVRVYGCVTHGHNDTVFDDDEIKNLVGKKPGAYGRHWVYGERHGRRSIEMKDCDILVVYGPEETEHITFVGREGLKECIEFLGKFER